MGYRTSGTTGAVRWKLAALDINKNSVASASPSPSDVSSATWTDQVGTYTVPANVAYVYLYAEIYLPTATTVARFDDGFVTTSPLYYVEDFLGSSRVTTRSNGVVCYDADFYPFGGERPYTNGCLENNYKFEGKERDTETGNDDFGARYYSNRFGRWLSSDWSAVPTPVPYAKFTNPQTLNLYSMVSDDPESFADLDGHDELGLDNLAKAGVSFFNGMVKQAVNTVLDIADASLKNGSTERHSALDLVPREQADNPTEAAGMITIAVGTAFIPGPGEEGAATIAGNAGANEAPAAAVPKEGIYEGPDATAPGKTYVGQSGNIPERLTQHGESGTGKFPAGTKVSTTEVKGGKTAREIAEQKRIDQLGGVKSKPGSKTSNERNPIGPKRKDLVNNQ
jgi:RHS repeat-associated protein